MGIVISIVLLIVFGLGYLIGRNSMKTDVQYEDIMRTDKEYLGNEIARLFKVLERNGIKEKIRLPSWLNSPPVNNRMRFEDVVDVNRKDQVIGGDIDNLEDNIWRE